MATEHSRADLRRRHRALAIGCLIAVMIVWGSTFVVTKIAAREIPPLTLAALRFLIAAIALAPLAIRRGILGRSSAPVPWRALILMALTGIAAFAIAFNYALLYGSAAQGAMLYALVPAAVAFSAVWFLKERASKQRIAGIALSIVGVALVVVSGETTFAAPHPLLGAAWMLGAVASWTAYTILVKRAQNLDFVTTIAAISAIGALMLLPLAALELLSMPSFSPSLSAWSAAIYLGVAASALAYIAYGFALRVLDATVVGVYTNLNPIVGVATAVIFLGETLHRGQVLGGLIVFLGMWLASRESVRD
ncbi:MAG: DMT family transporter [Xanthomonadaceae bacterium]|nr:DMT family transporter [Xanthomonadaceae bacterium]